MGYALRRLHNNKTRTWRVEHLDRTGNKSKTRVVKEDEYRRHGLRADMALNEVKQVVDSLNAQERIERLAARKIKIQERLETDELRTNARFPPFELQLFEQNELYRLIAPGSIAHRKRATHWKAAKEAIAGSELEPSDWSEYKTRFYDYFLNKLWSPSYVQKILPLINKWGAFFARRRKIYFEPIPPPVGNDLEALAEGRHGRIARGLEKETTSAPLTPQQLAAGLKAGLPITNHNWLYLTIWLGTRPLETDNLLKPASKRTWQLDESGKKPIIWVYQTKLHGKGLKEKERIKPIPLICKEQLACIDIIAGREFKRPLVKTIQKYCGEGINTYGGRKGFTDLWLGRKQSLENISIWLGHRSIERTWKSYKDKQLVRWD